MTETKYYFYAVIIDTDKELLFAHTTTTEIKVDDYVVVDNGYLEPTCAKVTKIADKVKAIASKQPIHDVIDTINIKPYLDKKVSEAERDNVIKGMKDEIENVKLMETLEKYSGKSPLMREYYEILKKLEEGQG